MGFVTELRTAPRQRRSRESVAAILDAAERLIHEQGQISFTSNELAGAAGMSVGRVYYWFPDTPAVVGALAERLRDQLAERYDASLAIDPEAATEHLTAHVNRALCEVAEQHPALVTICTVGGALDYGAPIRAVLTESTRSIAAERVPGLTTEELEVIAATVFGVQLGVLREYLNSPPHLRPLVCAEFSNVITAWVSARFPFQDDPVWERPDAPVRPVRPHRPIRPSSSFTEVS